MASQISSGVVDIVGASYGGAYAALKSSENFIIRVTDANGQFISQKVIKIPGDYEISIPSGKQFFIEGFYDQNENNQSDPYEAHKSFSNTSFSVHQDYESIDLSLSFAPNNLTSISPLNFAENQSIGSVVGEFNATDPDGDTITYSLVDGNGSGDNSLFSLDANGTLKTATTFDFESNALSYSIRVQAKDEYNATLEGTFTVSLSDVYEPSLPNHVVDLNSSVNLEMIWVEPGNFTMGSPITETGRNSNETEQNATLSRGFYLGKYEVTQAQYSAVMTGNTDGLSAIPSQFGGNPNRPVEKVSWNDIQVFLERLNEQMAEDLPAGWEYVLPTEAQWEYACRAGTSTKFSWGDTITSGNANWNYLGDYSNHTSDVGQYSANFWGFHDMLGNVWELCSDWYAPEFQADELIDWEGPISGDSKLLRGGGWSSPGSHLRTAFRNQSTLSFRGNARGFRLSFQYTNKVPSDLNSTAPLTIAENQPIGTIVAEFNATDPDTNATLTYSLVDGNGSMDNALFTIESQEISSFPGLLMWLDGKDHSSIETDSFNFVERWTDKSGKGNDLSKWNADTRPTKLSTGGITLENGKWLVTQPWQGSTPVELAGNPDFTLIIAAKGDDSGKRFFVIGNGYSENRINLEEDGGITFMDNDGVWKHLNGTYNFFTPSVGVWRREQGADYDQSEFILNGTSSSLTFSGDGDASNLIINPSNSS